MTVALVVITDGRPYLPQMLKSLREHAPQFDRAILVDDSGERTAATIYPLFDRVAAHDYRQGLAAAVTAGWSLAAGCDFVFHVEDDWTFRRAVPLDGMAEVLTARPGLAQVVLKRPAWNPQEIRAGGLIELNPGAYTDETIAGRPVVTHRECYSLNPHLAPRSTFEAGWLPGDEGLNTDRLTENPDCQFAFWGTKKDAPLIDHIGISRSEAWRL